MIAGDLVGKVVVITGANGGIGAAVAAGFAAQGAKVAIHWHSNREKGEKLAAEIRSNGGDAITFQANLASSAGVQQLYDGVLTAFGRIDVLVNAAGGMVARRGAAEVDDAFLDEVLNLNVRSMVLMCRCVIPLFRKQGGGNIINVSSSTAKGAGGGGMSVYSGTKGFVWTFTKSLAKELAKDKIRVNAVSPGLILTPAHERLSTPEHLEAARKAVPMGRLGQPDDCVGAFLYFASDALSAFATGAVLEVAGGA